MLRDESQSWRIHLELVPVIDTYSESPTGRSSGPSTAIPCHIVRLRRKFKGCDCRRLLRLTVLCTARRANPISSEPQGPRFLSLQHLRQPSCASTIDAFKTPVSPFDCNHRLKANGKFATLFKLKPENVDPTILTIRFPKPIEYSNSRTLHKPGIEPRNLFGLSAKAHNRSRTFGNHCTL